jgi:hypothetical protein
MKVLENKKTELPLSGNEKATYADIVKVVVNTPTKEGLAIADIKSRLAILEQAEKNQNTLSFENTDAMYLQGLVRNFRWTVAHKDIVTFVDDVERMK